MVFEYPARVVRWVDGDTVILDVDQGFHDWKHDQSFRLLGINAPDRQPAKGIAAAFMRELAPVGTMVVIRTHKDQDDLYGRWLAEIFLTQDAPTSVNQALVAGGLAREYDGKTARPKDY